MSSGLRAALDRLKAILAGGIPDPGTNTLPTDLEVLVDMLLRLRGDEDIEPPKADCIHLHEMAQKVSDGAQCFVGIGETTLCLCTRSRLCIPATCYTS